MIKIDLQLFGRGRSGIKDIDMDEPGGGGGGEKEGGPYNPVGFLNHKSLKEALGKKGRKIGMYKAAVGANPKYSPDFDEYSKNCQRAVVAFEARRRGYNVTAQSTYKGDKLPKSAHFNKNGSYNSYWMGAFRHAKPEHIKASTPNSAVNKIAKKMKGYGEGSRAILQIVWKNKKKIHLSGHVINLELKNGKVHYLDAQVGGKYNPHQLLSKVRLNEVNVIRTDNLRFSERAKNSITSMMH